MMKNRLCLFMTVAGLAAAFGLATTAWGLDIGRTRTEAAIVVNAAGAQALEVSLAAELSNSGSPALTRERVVVGWQEVGGVDPQPFRVLIPAGCFVARRAGGFFVEDFRACGVEVAFGRRLMLPIVDFEARIVPRDDGTARIRVQAVVMGGGQEHALLGAIGGAAVGISIGTEAGRSLPVSAATVSGIEPEPF